MAQRITGLETEYGCLVHSSIDVEEVMPKIRDWLFEDDRFGLIDRHDRDWDEPAGNGGFLFNGGRVYIDMGHMEYCTPECASAKDVVRYDRAGDLLLLEATKALGLDKKVSFIRNNIDHYTGATFGCHENYSLSRKAPLNEANVLSLLTFLTLRVLYCGAGRIGTTRAIPLNGDPTDPNQFPHFQVSQRADFIQNDFFEWVQHNRAIINTRDEPLADPRHFRRLHLIHGDTNVLPSALFLKIGSTRLALDLLEENALPPLMLQDAVSSLRSLSRTLHPPWEVLLTTGRHVNALELLNQYYEKAASQFRGRDEETDAVLDYWNQVLQGLERDDNSMIGVVDWITKYYLLKEFRESEGLDWKDTWLESQDLEFHHIDFDRSLGLALAHTEGYWDLSNVDHTKSQPPTDSRACARSRLMREIQGTEKSYFLNWESVELPDKKVMRLLNPFQA